MREQIADGDGVLGTVRVLGEPPADAILEPKLALVVENHHRGGRGHDLGERGEIVEGAIGIDQAGMRAVVEPAVPLLPHHGTATTGGDRHPRESARLNGVHGHAVDHREAGGIDSHRIGDE